MINRKNFVDLLLKWYEKKKAKEKGNGIREGKLIESRIRDVENEAK